MKHKAFYFITITFFLLGQRSFGQTNLYSDLSLLFGNLPMNLPTKEIIAFVEKNKNFKGNSHYNLDISYSGIALKTNFFNLKPDTCFIEIVSNAQEQFTDSSLTSDISCFTLDASYSSADSSFIKNEIDRTIVKFSLYFSSGRIEKENERTYFYKSKTDIRPTLTLYISKDNDCYLGKRCIKLTYFKKATECISDN
jgi:hypothetical protein